MPIVCEPKPKWPTPFSTDLAERIIELIRALTTEGLARTPKHNVIGSFWNSVPFRCKGGVPEAFVFASLEFDGMYSSEQIHTAIEELRQTDPPILETAEAASVIPLGSFYTPLNPLREVYSFVHNIDSSLPASALALYPLHPLVLSFDYDGEKLGPWQWQVWSNRGDYRAIFVMRPDVSEWPGKQNVRRSDLAKNEQIPAIRLTASARSRLNVLGSADNILQKVFVPGRPPISRALPSREDKLIEKKSPKKKLRGRGRPSDTDSMADKRIADAWATKRYRTFAELGAEFGLSAVRAKQAVDRHRQRTKRRTKSN